MHSSSSATSSSSVSLLLLLCLCLPPYSPAPPSPPSHLPLPPIHSPPSVPPPVCSFVRASLPTSFPIPSLYASSYASFSFSYFVSKTPPHLCLPLLCVQQHSQLSCRTCAASIPRRICIYVMQILCYPTCMNCFGPNCTLRIHIEGYMQLSCCPINSA